MLQGVIFNRLSPMIYPGLKKKAEQELGIRVFGYIPELRDLTLESRHLGLVMPEEDPGTQRKTGVCKGEDPGGDRSGRDFGSSGESSGTSN